MYSANVICSMQIPSGSCCLPGTSQGMLAMLLQRVGLSAPHRCEVVEFVRLHTVLRSIAEGQHAVRLRLASDCDGSVATTGFQFVVTPRLGGRPALTRR